jgi:hypothetical protein
VSIRLDQADFDELQGNLLTELSLIDGTVSMARTMRAQLDELEAVATQKRKLCRKLLDRLRDVASHDPDHTPLPLKSSASKPPSRSRSVRPPPLPPRKAK